MDKGIDADAAALGHGAGQPVWDVRAAGRAAAHERPGRAQLLRRLQEVAAVGPQRRGGRRDDRRARRAREAAQPVAARVAVRRILALHRRAPSSSGRPGSDSHAATTRKPDVLAIKSWCARAPPALGPGNTLCDSAVKQRREASAVFGKHRAVQEVHHVRVLGWHYVRVHAGLLHLLAQGLHAVVCDCAIGLRLCRHGARPARAPGRRARRRRVRRAEPPRAEREDDARCLAARDAWLSRRRGYFYTHGYTLDKSVWLHKVTDGKGNAQQRSSLKYHTLAFCLRAPVTEVPSRTEVWHWPYLPAGSRRGGSCTTSCAACTSAQRPSHTTR